MDFSGQSQSDENLLGSFLLEQKVIKQQLTQWMMDVKLYSVDPQSAVDPQ